MIREILTLLVDDVPTQYYINFPKNRKKFSFQPTLLNKSAPSFDVLVQDSELSISGSIPENLGEQAKEKVREILSNSIFDKIK